MAENETNDTAEPKTEKPAETKAQKPEQETETPKPKTTDEKPKDKESSDVKPDVEVIEPELTNEFKLPSAGEQHPLNRKSMKKVLIGVLIVAVLAILGGVALWVTHDTPVSQSDSEIVYTQGAAVTAVEGDVEFNAGQGWNLVESGTELKEGYSLRTLDASRAVITLDEGSAIRLDSDTVVTLTKLTAEEVIVDNESGQVYTRVVPSTTRVFVVTIGDQSYQAKGTAYKTVNKEEEKGVEVYESKVDVKDKTEVGEGETYFTNTKDASKKEKIAKLDLEKLAKDDFLNWNKAKDESNSEFADKLGFIKDLGKKDEPKTEPVPEPTPGIPAGIILSGSKGADGITLSWSTNGINESDGFKVVFDKSDTSPTYGENSAKYMSPGTYSFNLKLTDGKAYNIRVCAYRAEAGSCDSYSNLVTVTAPNIPKEQVTGGAVDAQIVGDSIAWTNDASAPYGYKVVRSTVPDPTYESADKKYFWTSGQFPIPSELEAGTYNFRVCKYNKYPDEGEGPCLYYSDNLVYTKS